MDLAIARPFSSIGSEVRLALRIPTPQCGLYSRGVGIGISEYDIAAICLGVYAAAHLFPGRPIVLRADNRGALGAASRGARCAQIGRLLATFLRGSGQIILNAVGRIRRI